MPIYVQHEVLGKVNDVFNAEAIWQPPGLALFARRPTLRDLLERCPREQRGRAATRCFSHITLMLPQEDVDDDRHLTRGARCRDLAQTLTALHQKDFGDLLGGDEVRYDVIGTEGLAEGEIEVKFGHAVYVPAADERIQYNVSCSRDSAIWKPVCPIYPNQRLALLGGDTESASYAVPGWPFATDGSILLINDGPDAQIEVQVRPKEAFDCHYDPLSGYYTIKSRRGAIDAGGSAQRLLLKIARVSAAPVTQGEVPRPAVKPAAVWHARSSTPIVAVPRDAERTVVPQLRMPSARPAAPEGDATFAPILRQRVSLAALTLPRLSRYRDTGAQALEIALDEALGFCAEGQQAAISFSVDVNDELYARTGDGRQRIAAPAKFTPVDGRSVRLLDVTAAMADRYCGMLVLPQPVSVPVASGARFVFGRTAPMLSALRVLDSPRFLQRAADAEESSADRLGLSRNAFSFEIVDGIFRIGRLSAAQALYHLDEQLQFVASIGEATASKPYNLPSGHHLVAGHYVLRFEA